MRLCCVVGAASAFAVTPAMGQAQQSTGTLSGSVTDVSGALVANASVILVLDRGSSPSTIATDAAGRFRALSLSPGLYKVSIDAPGFHPAEIKAEVAPGKDVTLAPVVLTAYARADVTVTTSQHDLAEAEVKAEEHQRLLGAIPNFYVTYDWQAAPLSTAQKYELGWRTIIDPVTLGLTAVQAGVQQATNEFPGYGSGPASYFKRFGAGTADTVVGTLLGGSILPALFHQDPRYFYLGRGTIIHRTLYALSTSVVARGDNGKWQPAYASILGDLGAGAISNLYYPASDRHGASLTFENGLLSIAFDGVGNVIQEFLLRRLTPKAPTYPPPALPSPSTKIFEPVN
jgi:hypothetical protein